MCKKFWGTVAVIGAGFFAGYTAGWYAGRKDLAQNADCDDFYDDEDDFDFDDSEFFDEEEEG